MTLTKKLSETHLMPGPLNVTVYSMQRVSHFEETDTWQHVCSLIQFSIIQ